MIKSMTGFGQSTHDDGKIQVTVELRSLNSKFLDITLRLPKQFSDREIEVRNLLSERLERGKINLIIDCQRFDADAKVTYNEDLFKSYYEQLQKLALSVDAPTESLFTLALESPDVIQNKIDDQSNEADWVLIRKSLVTAIEQCDGFRSQEGKTMGNMLAACCEAISKGLEEIRLLDPKRVDKVREKIRNNVVGFFGEEGFDMNRLEQELIYYIEKLDINEEKVRLQSHIDYFLQALKEKQSNGKKLSFISQEMGREINTIGSKANNAEIQKQVVGMKEELEKIKEQLNNVL